MHNAPIHILDFIDRHQWTFAKTMPEIPHWYIVRDHLSDDDRKLFDEFEAFIRKNGYTKLFYSKPFTYFEIGEYKYWLDENILNRDRIAPKP